MLNYKESRFAAIAQNVAPTGIMLSFFIAIYSATFTILWPYWGLIITVPCEITAIYIFARSCINVSHSRRFVPVFNRERQLMNHKIGAVYGISYAPMWPLLFYCFWYEHYEFLIPIANLLLTIQFALMALVFKRKRELFPAALLFGFAVPAAIMAFCGFRPALVSVIASIGGNIALIWYGFYNLKLYRHLAEKYGVVDRKF